MMTHTQPQSAAPRTLSITCQNRPGAMNRVLDALSHRGILPHALMSALDPETGYLRLLISFKFDDNRGFEKLVKALQAQVMILTVQPMISSREAATLSKAAAEAFVSPSATKAAGSVEPIGLSPLPLKQAAMG
jgi:acetolactate synthase small subunit